MQPRWVYFCIVAAFGASASAASVQPYGLAADGVAERSALGFAAWPRLSWSLAAAPGAARGAAQTAFRVTVCAVDAASTGACGAAVLDSGLVTGATQHWDPLAAGNASAPAPPTSHSRYVWNVTVTDAASGAQASAAAGFVAGIVASPADWLGAEWLEAADAIHGRVRLAFAAPPGGAARAVLTVAHSANVAPYVNGAPLAGGEWRCRVQSDVSLCATTRELDVAALAPGPAPANVLALAMSAGPGGAAPVWRARLTLFDRAGGVAELVTRGANASQWRCGHSSYALFAGGGAMSALASNWSQAWERANAGWVSDAAFDEAAANAAGPPAWAWAPARPAPTGTWGGNNTPCVTSAPEGVTVTLSCAAAGAQARITNVSFASFGTPAGNCGSFFAGSCAAPGSAAAVSAACVGAASCRVPVASGFFGGDPCLGTPKFLSAEVACSLPVPPPAPPPLFDSPAHALFTPTRVAATLAPVSLKSPFPGRWVWSLAQNIVGWCAIALPALPPSPALAGTQLRFSHGERLYADGTVFQFYKDQFHIWNNLTLILDGSTDASVFNISLSQMTFQHIQVEDWPNALLGGPPALSALECYQVATEAPPRGSFTSSSPLLNAVFNMQLQTIVNSNQGGLPLSDPERDDCDWLGDGHLAAESAATFLDAAAFYARSLEVLGDVDAHCARIAGANETYTIPYIIPASTDAACQGYIASRPGFEWEVAYAVFLDVLAVHFNNTRAIGASYAGVEMLVRSVQHLVDAEGGVLTANVWGDWANVATGITSDVCTCGILPPYVHKNDSSLPCSCQGTTTPNRMGGAWTSGFYYIYACDALARWAATLGDAARAADWAARRDTAGAAYNLAFVKRAPDGTWFVDAGTDECVACMGAAAMALSAPAAAGVLNATARAGLCAHLAAAVEAKGGRLDTGVLATRWLLPAMSGCGLWDAAFGVVSSTELPSWGFWLARGLTTTAEQWWEEGTPEVTGGALSHPMFSTSASWLVSALAGIALQDVMTAAAPDAPFAIAPVVPAALDAAAAAIETARGRVASSWAQALDAPTSLALNVTVPPGTAARIVLPFPRAGAGVEPPAIAVAEGGAPVFARGAFVPGVDGVSGAALVPPSEAHAWWSIAINVASGDYAFEASAE